MDFKDCIWADAAVITSQIEILFERFKINTAKIGIVQSWQILEDILSLLHRLNPKIKVILDPVIRASSGFDFHSTESQQLMDCILEKCFIITPNYNEIKQLYPYLNTKQTIEHISKKTNIYLKGGHRTDKKGWDELYHSKTVMLNLGPKIHTIYEKHGSGCVLSSALAANLALNVPLEETAKRAKHYTERFLSSTKNLLGYHN